MIFSQTFSCLLVAQHCGVARCLVIVSRTDPCVGLTGESRPHDAADDRHLFDSCPVSIVVSRLVRPNRDIVILLYESLWKILSVFETHFAKHSDYSCKIHTEPIALLSLASNALFCNVCVCVCVHGMYYRLAVYISGSQSGGRPSQGEQSFCWYTVSVLIIYFFLLSQWENCNDLFLFFFFFVMLGGNNSVIVTKGGTTGNMWEPQVLNSSN